MPILLHHPMNRRSFLQTAALGGAALAVTGCRSLAPSAASPTEWHLALLSDTHVPGDRVNGHRGFNPWQNLHSVVPAVVASAPEGTILCGDAARLEGREADYREVAALLEPLAAAAPVFIGLGNHDDRANFLKVCTQRPGTHAAVDGKCVTVIEHPVARLIVLDSLLYTNKVAGLLGKAQRKWLAGYLPTIGDRPAVLFVHHTLGNGDGDLLDAGQLFALAKPCRHVKAIFYGHSHVWELGRRDRLKLVNLPAVGYNFRDQDPVGWVDARFRPDGVALTLHAFAGNRADDGKTSFVEWS